MSKFDINKAMKQATRAAGRDRATDVRHQASVRQGTNEPLEHGDVTTSDHLLMVRRQGVYRYELAGRRVRNGDRLEVYANPGLGWLPTTFQWGRRRHVPCTLEIELTHPTARDPDGEPLLLGVLEMQVPEEAVVRWPSGGSESE